MANAENPSNANPNARWAPKFFVIWGGQAFSLLGSQLVQFALVWWMAKTTGSATVLAAAMIAGLLPSILIGPFAGALVDRWNRRMVMIAADGLIALGTLLLVILFALGSAQFWHVFAILFLRALGQAFHNPAMQASTSLMVPDKHLARIAGMNQLLDAAMGIVAPPVGALLVIGLPMAAVLSIDIVTALLAIAPLCFVQVPQPPGAASVPASYWANLREGFQYVASWRGLLLVCLLAAALNFVFAPLSALLPLMVIKFFGGSAMALGAIDSAFAVGMIIGATVLSLWGGFKSRIATTLLSIVFLGPFTILLGLAPYLSFGAALAGILLIGVFLPIANGPLRALLQSIVSPEKQGRVFSLVGSLSGFAMPAGLLVAGPSADWLGIPAVFVLSGVLAFGLAVASLGIPAIRKIEEQKPN
jgi:DHA3 family macrolide efflux protein-like MFS transporter